MIPYYLQDNATNIRKNKYKTTFDLKAKNGNEKFELYFYGEKVTIKKLFSKKTFIIDETLPALIVAKEPISKEEIVIFDGAKHGYDAMFNNDYSNSTNRDLERYEGYYGRIEITAFYNINYDEEIGEYEFASNGNVILKYGELDWNLAKSIGFDCFQIKTLEDNKIIFTQELA